ncbi:MAG: O-antigen ligase family protein [Verrucomicrobia bacterium]|nr:O-antigen ligase family protein [Verrucomicrobiota bacterium]
MGIDVNLEPRIQDSSTADMEFQIKRWLPVLAGIVLAIYAGYWVGNNNWTPLWRLLWIAIIVFVAFSLQDRGWVLIPMFWMAPGSITLLPLPFSWRESAILLALAAYVAHRCLVRTPRISLRHVLFFLLMINLAWVALMWLRRPVGFRVFQSEFMGARFYFGIFIAGLAGWILLHLPQSAKTLTRIPYYLFAGTWIGAIANTLVFLLPATTGLVLSFYGQASVDMGAPVQVLRFSAFRETGLILVLLLVSHCKPFNLFHFVRPHFYLLVAGLAGVAISGFRSSIATALAYIGLSMILRRNWRQLVLFSIIGLTLLAGLIAGQGRFYSLPLAVQRALCFLPGNWSMVAVQDAAGTATARFDWWRDIIKYRLIDNWWIGDGIGVRRTEATAVYETTRRDYSAGVFFYGDFHNGPLTTIRCVGFVGLILLYALMIFGIVHALRCLRRCRETTLEPLAMFIAIPIVWFPIHFTLVFGSFEFEMPQVLFQTGLLLLLIRMLNEHPELLTNEQTTA